MLNSRGHVSRRWQLPFKHSAAPTALLIAAMDNPALPGWADFGFRPSPGFPVDLGGVGELHAPFFMERRTRGSLQCSVTGNPGPGLYETHQKLEEDDYEQCSR
jgi:hypothetical protein